jgi:hypothetical protein
MPPPLVYKRDDGALRGGIAPFVRGTSDYEIEGMRLLGQGYKGSPALKNPRGEKIVRGATRYFESGFGEEADGTSNVVPMDAEMGECLEGLLQLRETRDLVVMTMNMHHFASWPKDPDAGYYELCRITEVSPPPDIICVQEGIVGRDVLSELGYQLLVSSESCSQPLREALYQDANALRAARDAHHNRLVVNELYVRVESSSNPLEWEVVDQGAARISSDEQTTASGSSKLPLALRSVVWAKLRHRTQSAGPSVFLVNTQLTGDIREQNLFSEYAVKWERRKQVERVLDFIQSQISGEDLGVFVGDLGVAVDESSQDHTSSPFGMLAERGWTLAYGLSQVGPSSSSGELVDHMATSRSVPVLAKVFATTNQEGLPPVTQTPLSDHNVVKATFSMRYPVSEADKAIIQGIPEGMPTSPTSPQEYYIGDDEGANLLDEATRIVMRRKAFPLSYRPDEGDTSYVGVCARYEFECQDLMNERVAEQQAMEDITSSLSEQMWRLRDQCSEQIHGKSVLIQRIQEANDSVTTMNETWAIARANLQAELEDEKFHKEQVEAEFRAEEEEARAQVAQCRRQLENMEEARRFLGRHRICMANIKDMMVSDIEDEKRMTTEIAEAGDTHLSEWSEQQQEIRNELQDALAAHNADYKRWKGQMTNELDRARARKLEVEGEEFDVEQRLRRAQEELAQQTQDLQAEVHDKARELQEINARIQDVKGEFQSLEAARPQCEENARISMTKIAEKRSEADEYQAEIGVLCQETARIKRHVEELKESEAQQAAQIRRTLGAIPASEDVSSLEQRRLEYDELISQESQRREDLMLELQRAQQRGLFSCFFPQAKKG